MAWNCEWIELCGHKYTLKLLEGKVLFTSDNATLLRFVDNRWLKWQPLARIHLQCGLLKVTGKRKFKNLNFLMLPDPTHIDMTFLSRNDIRNLILKLWSNVTRQPRYVWWNKQYAFRKFVLRRTYNKENIRNNINFTECSRNYQQYALIVPLLYSYNASYMFRQ
jgi:hypothetical protein